jgi:hypothetical protein
MRKTHRSLSRLSDRDRPSYEFKFTQEARAILSAADSVSPLREDRINTRAGIRLQESDLLAAAVQAKLCRSEFVWPGAKLTEEIG